MILYVQVNFSLLCQSVQLFGNFPGKKKGNKITINNKQHCKIILITIMTMLAAITKNTGVIMIMTAVKISTKLIPMR